MFLETIRVEDGSFKNLKYHEDRVSRTLSNFGVENRVDLWRSKIRGRKGAYRCSILYFDEVLDSKCTPLLDRSFKRLSLAYSDSINYSYKYKFRESLNSLRERYIGDSDEIVIVKDGLLTDTTISNIALYNGDSWVTPKTPLLRGTTRERLLRSGKLQEADISVNTIYSYKKFALINALLDFYIIESDIKDIFL